jgi:hypothetical protein
VRVYQGRCSACGGVADLVVVVVEHVVEGEREAEEERTRGLVRGRDTPNGVQRADGVCGCEARVEGVGVGECRAQDADIFCYSRVESFPLLGVRCVRPVEEEAEEVQSALCI